MRWPAVVITTMMHLSGISQPTDVKTYLVVIGAFTQVKNANPTIRTVLDYGLVPKFQFDQKKGLHYLYVFESTVYERATTQRNDLRRHVPFKDAWIYTKTTEVATELVTEKPPTQSAVAPPALEIPRPTVQAVVETKAQEPPPMKTEPTIEKVTTPVVRPESSDTSISRLQLSGYVDMYYLHAMNDPKSGTLMGHPSANKGAPAGRAFDRVTDQFALGLVQTKLSYSDRKADVVIDLTFGPNAQLSNYGNTQGTTNTWISSNGYVSQLYGTSAAIKQAYFTFKASERWSFTVGQFGTPSGYEVIDAPMNYHYSLSNLFNNGPFYHLGAKVNYRLGERISLMTGIVNNWDNLFDNNKQKSVIAQAQINPGEKLHLWINYMAGFGDDTALTTAAQSGLAPYLENYHRSLFDLILTYQLTSKLHVSLNGDYGVYYFQSKLSDRKLIESIYGSTQPVWKGLALYADYTFNDWLGIGVRSEYFDDSHHVRTLGAKNISFTFTLPISLANQRIIIKPEVRVDRSSFAYYEDRDGKPIQEQQTAGIAFICKY